MCVFVFELVLAPSFYKCACSLHVSVPLLADEVFMCFLIPVCVGVISVSQGWWMCATCRPSVSFSSNVCFSVWSLGLVYLSEIIQGCLLQHAGLEKPAPCSSHCVLSHRRCFFCLYRSSFCLHTCLHVEFISLDKWMIYVWFTSSASFISMIGSFWLCQGKVQNTRLSRKIKCAQNKPWHHLPLCELYE